MEQEQQTMEEYLLSQLDSMPGTIERNGKRYRLRISKSGKSNYAVQYKPLDNGTALYELTDSNFKKSYPDNDFDIAKEGVMT